MEITAQAPPDKLDKRRFKLYAILLLFQALTIISNLIIIPASKQPNVMLSFEAAVIIDLVLVVCLTAANMYFLHHFIRRRLFFFAVVILVAISIVLNFLQISFKFQETNFEMYRLIFGISTLISLFVIGVTFIVAVRDIFGEKIPLGDSLLGATNVYLLISAFFTFVYAIMNILMPGAVVADAEINTLYNQCYIFSAHVLGGVDIPDNHFGPAMKNIMVFESIFAHLFAVFVVGRLLLKST